MNCNSCWNKISYVHKTNYYITQCSHLFCHDCAARHFTNSNACPKCGQVLEEDGLAITDLAPTAEKIKLLCGLDPTFILEAASRAIEFWAFQHDLSKQGEGEAEKLRQRINEMEKSHQQSILLLQNNMKSLSSQLDSVKMERDIQKRELIELHEQYSERTRQKKQLEELYNKLKNKSDDSLTASPRTSPFPISSSSPFKPKTFIQPSSKVVNKESKSDIFKTGSPLSKHKPSPVKYNMKNLFNSQNSRSPMHRPLLNQSTPTSLKAIRQNAQPSKPPSTYPSFRLQSREPLERPSTPLLNQLSSRYS